MTRYITASIPYVNSTPHIGYAVELFQVDVLLRYYKSRGEMVRGQFGSDDNSLKNVRAARDAGEETEIFVARHAEEFRKLADELGLDESLHNFIRTRDDLHMRGAQKLWSMFRPEDIDKRAYEGLYCVGCEAFYAQEDLLEGNLCPTHKKSVEVIKEENYFFKLSNYQTFFEDLLKKGTATWNGKTHSMNIVPEERRNEMLAFVKKLEDFSISRSVQRAENWGVPVPGDESQVMYVWVDALSNYITALGFADDAQAFADFWTNAHVRTHVIGKDIVRFHAIYWPAFLLSAGLSLPTEITVHGFFAVEGEKMSKSIGNVIHPKELVDLYGIDATRYLLLRELPLLGDGDISRARLEERYNDLANSLGNLVGRVAAMGVKYFDGVLDVVDVASVAAGFKPADSLHIAMESRDFKKYLELVQEYIAAANAKIQIEEPFKSAKTNLDACKKTLSELAAMIRFIAEVLSPIMPSISKEILARYTGEKVIHGAPLFPKREQDVT
ncbi:MAG: methionine--tRNA ligase [Patescibacteria group bacterium]